MKEIRIVIADDHAMVRQGIRALLEAEEDMRVVAEATTGLEAIDSVERVKPNVLVLDLMLPGLDGLEVARLCHQRWPETKVVVMSMHSHEAYVSKALRMGAKGYVVKSSEARELMQAIRSVMLGKTYLSSSLSEQRVRAISVQAQAGASDLFDVLTRREKQILQLTTEGLTNARMAKQLGISPRTVEVHRANLMKKLNVDNHSQLVRFSLSRGLFPPDDLPPPPRPGA